MNARRKRLSSEYYEVHSIVFEGVHNTNPVRGLRILRGHTLSVRGKPFYSGVTKIRALKGFPHLTNN